MRSRAQAIVQRISVKKYVNSPVTSPLMKKAFGKESNPAPSIPFAKFALAPKTEEPLLATTDSWMDSGVFPFVNSLAHIFAFSSVSLICCEY